MKPGAASAKSLAFIGRWILGGLFVYMGLNKALSPVEFLKLLREYELTQNTLCLNSVAAGLPWFEIFLGVVLITGVAVRGAALVSLAMLIPFTVVVFRRAVAIHQASGTPFCGIRFDCGCGGGEVLICRKLVENCLLVLLAGAVFWITARSYNDSHSLKAE